MNLILTRTLCILARATLLVIRTSLPLQALALLMIRGATAVIIACKVSILLGIYTILIYARGLLVLLAYFVALSPNQTLNTPARLSFFVSLTVVALVIIQTWPSSSLFHLTPAGKHSSNVVTILTPYSSSLLIVIALVLVLTMVAVVKSSSVSSGPVRPWRSN